ncbi:hypothetical protein CCB80_04885 [Armatimonadetes bacterium Uphvl-Ar1]|nr:hypothetical protein CCB80_04885 [Armatimonadetes bacterium Uphvl-Ar1]
MLPWLLTYSGTVTGPVQTEPLKTKTVQIRSAQAVPIETLELRRTAGVHAKEGDRVTVRYRFFDENRVLVDSERMGFEFSFTLGDGSVPDVFDMGVSGLQLKGFRRARVNPSALGDGFESRWPEVKKSVTFEVTLVGLSRPSSP